METKEPEFMISSKEYHSLTEAWNSCKEINPSNPLAAAKGYKEVVQYAQSVIELLTLYGKDIVPHLLDTDDNAGEHLRRALAKIKE